MLPWICGCEMRTGDLGLTVVELVVLSHHRHGDGAAVRLVKEALVRAGL